ncbi:MAG: ABC transporter ATP-binding protein [Clostridiales bacterium]|nr:ABC transporter ATP-binding protein [Clostridiales bacterium]
MSAKQENRLSREESRRTLRRVLHLIRPYLIYIISSLLCAVVSVVAQLLVPIFCGDAIDVMIGAGRVVFASIIRMIIAIAAATGITAAAQWILSVCNNRIVFGVSRDLRNAAIRKIQTLPFSYLDVHPSGDLVSRIIADVDTFADGLLMGFTQLFTGVLTILGTLGFMISVNLPITLVVVCLTPLSLFVASFIARHTYRHFQRQTAVRGEQTALINEMISGQKVVQAFGHEAESLNTFDEVNDRLQSASMKAVFFSSLTNPCTRFVNSMVYVGVGLTGALFAISGGISVGQLSVFLSYANQYAKPFNEISGVVTELQNALACAARVFQLLDEQDEIPDSEQAAVLESDGRVALEQVSFRYVPERPLIENFTLAVKPGQRIALVGPTGCGKTTLINLLMRFYDVDSGSIKVSGQDIRQVTRASLRRNYGMVLQDTWLKAGTIRENIAYGKPDATEEEIVAAAKAAHADSYIRRLPQGYDTVITEDGGNISQGQKQLLCIARVMLCLPPMLILDEATSSIDTRTEIKIQSAFARMMEGRTSFIVAHRLSTIREANVILVMKDGHIIEQGDHQSLMAQNGFYANLYNSQFDTTAQT